MIGGSAAIHRLVVGSLAIAAAACTHDFDGLLGAGGAGPSAATGASTGGGTGSGTGEPSTGSGASGGSPSSSSSGDAGAPPMSGGAGGTAGCNPGTSDQFQDDFQDGMPTGWNTYSGGSASIEETGGELRVHVGDTGGTANFAGYTSIAALDLRGCGILVRPVALPADDVQAYMGFGESGFANAVAIGADAGLMSFCVATAGEQECIDEPYVAATDVWWRIRADASQVLLETSPDASTWSVRRTIAPLPAYVAAGYADLGAGSQDPVMGSYDAGLDDFNLPP